MAHGHSHHSGGMLMLDTLAAHSGLRRVSPGLKTAFTVLVLLLCVGAADAVVGIAVAASMAALMWLLGKVSPGQIFQLLRIPMLFAVVSCTVILLEPGHEPFGIWQLHMENLWFCVTRESLHRAVTLFFQAMGAVTCLYFLSATTPMPQLIEVLRRCHVPELVIELMHLIYRYLFVLLDVQQKRPPRLPPGWAMPVRTGQFPLRAESAARCFPPPFGEAAFVLMPWNPEAMTGGLLFCLTRLSFAGNIFWQHRTMCWRCWD